MTQSVHALLTALVDYAGLFPPAGLAMRRAAENYAAYRESPYSFALGRFVVPVSRLGELATEGRDLFRGDPWRLSALTGPKIAEDAAAIASFNVEHEGRAVIDSVEIKVADAAAIDSASRAIPQSLTVYFEIPVTDDPRQSLTRVAQNGWRAKIRTGGITPEAFPAAEGIVRFMAACREAGVAFKATAGLHHPIRCMKPLTYEPGAVSGTMHGFANVFLAAALILAGRSEENAIALLEEDELSAFTVGADGIDWRDETIAAPLIRQTRSEFALSFGSCSFEEPIDDLKSIGWLR